MATRGYHPFGTAVEQARPLIPQTRGKRLFISYLSKSCGKLALINTSPIMYGFIFDEGGRRLCMTVSPSLGLPGGKDLGGICYS